MPVYEQRRVIFITDGDAVVHSIMQQLAREFQGRCISASAGNPTELSGKQIVQHIMETPHDPVFVMFDDNGKSGTGFGERALQYVTRHPQMKVLGVLAVASETKGTKGVFVDCSVNVSGQVIDAGVDKHGNPHEDGSNVVYGDTLECLNDLPVPFIVGIGDIGKMYGRDHLRHGAPITRKALQLILKHHRLISV